MVMITSSPNTDNSVKWPGKTDGVQMESIGYKYTTASDNSYKKAPKTSYPVSAVQIPWTKRMAHCK